MAKPIIAIIGRPNVGKSTLFNKLAGRSKAIIRNVHGVTRDRNYCDIRWEGAEMTLIDTGGFFPDTDDRILSSIRQQALYAIDEADMIIHLLDGKEGLNPLDLELANAVRKAGKKTLWVVNKIDSQGKLGGLSDFYELGASELFPISAETGFGIDDLMDRVIKLLPLSESGQPVNYPKIAIVGRPNVGKSTIVNSLMGKERMIVSPIAGTTRDSVDSICTYYGKKYLLIDTAGIRRKPKVDEVLEELSVLKSIRSIDRADVVVIVLDAVEGIVEQDQKIIGIAHRKGKGILILFNKWDLVTEHEKRFRRLSKEIYSKLWFIHYAPILTTSAVEKKRLFKIYPIINEIMKETGRRIPTAKLNHVAKALERALPTYKGKRVKLYYMTQIGTRPPSFALFVNVKEGIKAQHERMIEKKIREEFPFQGTSIRLFIRRRRKNR